MPVNDGAWHYGGWVYDGTAVRLYLDGKEVDAVATSTLSLTVSNPLCFASYDASCSNFEFSGALDDIRIYDRALSADEVAAQYRLGAATKMTVNQTLSRPSLQGGLVGYWTMDGKNVDLSQPAAEVRDTSGQGNHGNWLNHASTTAPGAIGQALEFDGYDDYVDAGSPASLDNLSNFTYAAWIRIDGYVSNFLPIMGKGNGSAGANVEKRFVVNSNDATCTGGDGSTDGCLEISINTSGATRAAYTPAGTIRPGRWYHVAVTYANGTAPKVYVNGVESSYVSQNAGSGTDADEAAGPFLVGSWNHDGSLTPGGQGWFDGRIDDVRVYNRVLPPEEINKLYRLGR